MAAVIPSSHVLPSTPLASLDLTNDPDTLLPAPRRAACMRAIHYSDVPVVKFNDFDYFFLHSAKRLFTAVVLSLFWPVPPT